MHGPLKQAKKKVLSQKICLWDCFQHLEHIWDKIVVIIFSCTVLKRTFTTIQSISCCCFYGNCSFGIILLSPVNSETHEGTSAPESLQLEEVEANRW